jgi:hypothetical protein
MKRLKQLEQLKHIINMGKINNIIYNLCVNDENKNYLEIDKNPKSNKNFTDEKKIFIIKSVLNEVKNSKLITHYNNYFLFELEEESNNENN